MAGLTNNIKNQILEALKAPSETCGDCAGYATEKRTEKTKLCCTDPSIQPASKICKEFTPNTAPLKDYVADPTFQQMVKLVGALKKDQLRVLGSVLMREHNTRERGFSFGQVVYVRAFGAANKNYINNFMKAFVLFADHEFVRVSNKEGKMTLTFSNAVNNVYTEEEFKPLRNAMVKGNKITDPVMVAGTKKVLRCLEDIELNAKLKEQDYEVPTIDDLMRGSKTKTKKRKKNLSLVSIVSRVASGFALPDDELPTHSNKKLKTVKRAKKGVTIINVSD